MIGYENRVTSDESFVEDRKEFAEIPMGAATTVFFEVRVHDDVWRSPSQAADLGNVQLRWVTPMSGLTNRQSAAMTSRLDTELGATGDPLLEFGAVVALASDRYGSLPYAGGDSYGDVRRDLDDLSDRLQPLGRQLGHLDSYQDFAFLMDHMTAYHAPGHCQVLRLQPLGHILGIVGGARIAVPAIACPPTYAIDRWGGPCGPRNRRPSPP